jgi:hypothetical protein
MSRGCRHILESAHTSAWNGGDVRGWFHLVSASRTDANPPTCRGFAKKRLKGFEPSTFCMAIRPISETRRAANMTVCRDFVAARQTARGQQYAWMCADMQRFGNFGAEVPGTAWGGLICLKSRFR